MQDPLYLFLVLAGSIALAVAVIATERSDKRIARLGYLGWLAALLAVNVAAAVATNAAGESVGGQAIGFGLTAVAYLVFLRKSVQRARDVGIRKNLCYLLLVPMANFLMFMVLIFARTQSVQPARPSA